MCGIAGWIDWEQDLSREGEAESRLARMTDTLACRGPDAAGLWASSQAALGHRRLIVIDPEGGIQPMLRERGGARYVLSYNGELYNTQQLRQQLEARGHPFGSRSDTEVVLRAFMEWGSDSVRKLNGIFAYAIWDEERRRLFLARDRLGVKPLFYIRQGSSFLFGSEPKALLAHPHVAAEVDEEGLAEVLALGPARTPGHGVYRGMRELRPGRYLTVSRKGTRQASYWRLEARPHRHDLDETTARVRWLLKDTVERQLISDMPVCTLLSGGLDSSAITAFAADVFAQRGGAPLSTYSVDYRDNEEHFEPSDFQPDADAPWVRRVAAHLGTRHREVRLATPELVDALAAAMVARDLPGMADVDASLLLFCRAIKEEHTVALSGEAADELFGGYPWFAEAGTGAITNFPWSPHSDVRRQVMHPRLRRRIDPRAYARQRCLESLAEAPVLAGENTESARMRQLTYLNIVWFMATLLDRKDRMSMASGLEVRVPFCDDRLVQYVWNIPWALKAHGGQQKGILRRALEGVLPDAVRLRPKNPYPKTHNPDYLEAMRQGVIALLDDPHARMGELFDLTAIRRLALAPSEAPRLPWFGQLMTLPQFFAYVLQIESWLQRYQVSIRFS